MNLRAIAVVFLAVVLLVAVSGYGAKYTRPALPKTASVAVGDDFQPIYSKALRGVVIVPKGESATLKLAADKAVTSDGFGMMVPGSRITVTAVIGPGTIGAPCLKAPVHLGTFREQLLDTDGNVMLQSPVFHPQLYQPYKLTFTLDRLEAPTIAIVLTKEHRTVKCDGHMRDVSAAPALALKPKMKLTVAGPHHKRKPGTPDWL
jgi:hypothetical protein